MKRFLKHSVFSIFLILVNVIFASCEVYWLKNFKDEIEPVLNSKITYYSTDNPSEEGIPVKSKSILYRMGTTLSKSDLPDYTDSEIASWNPLGRLAGWHYYRVSNGLEDSHTVEAKDIDLYAFWHYGYYIDSYFEDFDGNYILSGEPVLAWGKNGDNTNVVAPFVEGFSPTVIDTTIEKENRNTAVINYARNTVELTFDPNGGKLYGDTNPLLLPKKYGESVTVDDPVLSGYIFAGWLPPLTSTAPATDTYYVAQWTDSDFSLSYADWNAGSGTGKICSASGSSFPTQYFLGVETELPDPVSTADAADNILFDGYYYDADCTNSLSKNASGKYYLKTTDSGDKTIYLKWKYKVVYVDPISGEDLNTGHVDTKPLKTIKEAKKYLACGQDESSLVLCSTLSDSAQISQLSGLSTASYHNAKIVNSSSLPHTMINIKDNVTLKNLIIESNSFPSAITVEYGLLTIDNLTANVNSNGAISLIQNGSLLISGSYNYNSTSDSSAVEINPSCTGSLYMSGSGRINSSNAVILQNGQKITISGPLTQSGIVATIYSAAPSTSPFVLTDNIGGSHVSSYYKKFASAHPGYTINSAGQLVEASGINLDQKVPAIAEYDPGDLSLTVVTKVSGGDTLVTFNVSDEAYEKIAMWGTDKYIQYTIDGSYGNIVITGSAGNYTAEINLTSLKSGTDPTVTPVNLMPGLHSLVIYAEAEDPLTSVITTEEYQIFVK